MILGAMIRLIDIVALLMLIPRTKGLKQKIDGDGKSPRLLSNRKHVIQFHHFYIHSFRAAQGTKRHEKNVGLLQLSFYNCSIGIFSILQITGR